MVKETIDEIINDDLQFFRERQVLALFPISRSQLWKLIKEERFPAPVKLSPKCSLWRGGDLRQIGEKLTTKKTKPVLTTESLHGGGR